MTKRMMALLWLVAISVGMAAHAQSIEPKKDEKKGTWGYVSKSNGKWVVKPKYDEATELAESPNGQLRGTVSLKGLKGLIDDTGKIQGAGVVFEEMTPMEGDAMFVKVKGKTGVADYSGVYKVKPEAESVEQLGSEGWIMTIKGKKGFLKNDGTWLLQPVYTGIDASVENTFIVNQGGKAGILDRQGQVKLFPKEYTKIVPCGDFWKVYKGDKVGLLDLASNRLLVKTKYSDVGVPINTSNGELYPVAKSGKWGYVNSDDKYIVKPEYQSYMPIPEMDAILLSISSTPDYIYISPESNIYSLRDYESSKDDIFNRIRFEYKRNDIWIPVDLITLPDGQIVISKEIVPIRRKREFFEVTGLDHFSVWDKNGNALYDGVDFSSPIDKYINIYKYINIVKGLNKSINEDSYGSYLDTLEDEVIRKPDYETIKILFDKRDMIGQTLLNKVELFTAEGGFLGMKNLNTGKVTVYEGREYKGEFYHNSYMAIASREGVSIIMNSQGKVGLRADDTGKILIAPNYDNISKFDIYNRDDKSEYSSNHFYSRDYWKVKKDGKMGLFDIGKGKMLIPLDKGYSNIGGNEWRKCITNRFDDSGICCVYTGDEENYAIGVWDLKTGKEVLKPSVNNRIEDLPKGYKGFSNNGVAYSPTGSKLTFSPAVDVYQAEWANTTPHFFTKLVGLEGRTVEFYVTAYTSNGSIYKDRAGQKCIYKFSQTETPTSQIEYGPMVVALVRPDIHLAPFSKLTLKFVLSAKDAKTGASIPVKGEKSVSAWFSRDW